MYDQKPLTIGGVQVIDAHIDWAINYSSLKSIEVQLEKDINNDVFLPLTGDTNNGMYVEEYDGIIRGFDVGSKFDNRSTTTVLHKNGDTIKGAWAYHHVVTQQQNRNKKRSVLNITLHGDAIQTRTVKSEKAKEIIDQFINGDEGSDMVSYWVWKRDKEQSWARANTNRSEYESVMNPEVVLVDYRSKNWYPKRKQDLKENDILYSQNNSN